MTETDEILKALDMAIEQLSSEAHPYAEAPRRTPRERQLAAERSLPILRAHRARLERERAFAEAAKDYFGCLYRGTFPERCSNDKGNNVTSVAEQAYRALVSEPGERKEGEK